MEKDIISRNYINRLGNGNEPMMFSHGYGCDQNMWRFITPAFEKDYDIILFDHVGSGNSDEQAYNVEKYNDLNGYADDIIEICEVLKLEKVTYVGHSVSSIIGILAAAKRPELFKKLILIGPSPCYINNDEYYGGFSKMDIDELIETLESNYLGWSSSITPVIAGTPGKPEFSEELHNSFCRMNPKIAKHFARVTFLGDNREDLSKVTVPALIIQSHPDIIAPVEVGKFVYKEMPKSSYTQLESPGHCPHLTEPEQTIRAMKSYLKKLKI
ncbi:alpha/beta hydrolase [Marivirga sp.]|uniref:alpha/beta fold hydrolase n=1 Tax=Marivirga sp. TaxID=2018662 RepID=UPI0025F42E45|nr:alpha/beta hydrolase [Marivirga sp.]